MTSYEFQSMGYSSQRAMLDAIASEWVTAGGANSAQDVKMFLRDQSATELANECSDGWGLALTHEDDVPSHMEKHDYDLADLREAFERLYDAWLRPVAHLPTDQVEAFIEWAMNGEPPLVETREIAGMTVTCIFSEADGRACIGNSGNGCGDSDWTDAADVDDAFRRFAEDDLAN